MKERVLITGASGFIGYHLVEAALKAGLEVYAAVRPASAIAHLQVFDIHYTTPDYTSVSRLKKEIEEKQYHYIIHAAGTTKARSEQEYEEVNSTYTRNLALAAAEAQAPLKKFVFISSLAAVGPIAYQANTAILEQSPAQPVTGYGRSKLRAEHYLAKIENLPWVILRPTAVYGPREKAIFILLQILNYGLDPYISRQAQRLSFVYVTDLTQATLLALRLEENRVIYNVSDGHCYNRYALADITKRVLGKKAFRFHLPLRLVKAAAKVLEVATTNSQKAPALNQEKLLELTAENWNCSIAKIKQLGFEPKYDLEKGLTETLYWYQANKWL